MWTTWEAFINGMVRAFVLATVVEEARQQILSLCWTGHVAVYVLQLYELLYRIPTMRKEESYMLFFRCLKPEVKT